MIETGSSRAFPRCPVLLCVCVHLHLVERACSAPSCASFVGFLLHFYCIFRSLRRQFFYTSSFFFGLSRIAKMIVERGPCEASRGFHGRGCVGFGEGPRAPAVYARASSVMSVDVVFV
jgi:hypothetical protein